MMIFPLNILEISKRLFEVSEIGAVVKVADSHPCGWGSIPSKSCSFFHGLIASAYRGVVIRI